MDSYRERLAPIAAVGLAAALLLIWSVMALAYAYNRSLAYMNNSFARRLMVQSEIDDLVSAVDQLAIDQRSFLSTGDARFEDGVYTSAITLDRQLDGLRAAMGGGAGQRARLAGLSAAIRQIVDCVGRSYDVKDARGAAAAMAFLDAHEAVVFKAKSRAAELRIEIGRDLSDQMMNARDGKGLVKAILDSAPGGFRFGPARDDSQGVSSFVFKARVR